MTQFDVSEPAGQLLLTVRPTARRPVMVVDFLVAGITLVLIVGGTAVCLRFLSSPWPVIGLLALFIVPICWQCIAGFLKERRTVQEGEVYRLDRANDRISHDGATIGAVSQIDQVLVRDKAAYRGRRINLTLTMRDGTEIILPTQEKPEMERLASQIANYVGMRVSYDMDPDF